MRVRIRLLLFTLASLAVFVALAAPSYEAN